MENLRDKLKDMSKAWGCFKELKDWPALGWLRATEVNKGQDGNPKSPLSYADVCATGLFYACRVRKKDRSLAMWRETARGNAGGGYVEGRWCINIF